MKAIPKVKSLFTSLCFLFFFSPFAGAQVVIPTDSSHFQTLRIDPSNAMGGNASDVFDEVNYIPLETTAESTFGTIYQLEIVDDYFIILDENTNSILLFDKKGKYHTKIAGSSDLRHRISRFMVNRWTKQIIFSQDSYRTFDFYDFNGKLVKHQDLHGIKHPTNAYFIGPDKLINCDMYRDEDPKSEYYQPYSRSLIQYEENTNNVYATGMHYTEAQGKIHTLTHGISPLTYFGRDTSLFYSETYNYKIYTVTPNAIKLTYKFVFPLAVSLPSDFTTNALYNVNRFDYFTQNKDQIFCINNVYLIGNNLLFDAHSDNYDNGEDVLFYNLKSGGLVAYKHILTDQSSFFLPLYTRFDMGFDNRGFTACDGKYIYTGMSSLNMFKAHEANKADGKKIKYNAALNNYFEKGTKRDNPVILQLKIKDKL